MVEHSLLEQTGTSGNVQFLLQVNPDPTAKLTLKPIFGQMKPNVRFSASSNFGCCDWHFKNFYLNRTSAYF
jgi:hypothetical protein